MAVVCIVGGQWGDEGKGKVIDLLASQAQLVVRYSGGNNAGHTVVNDRGTFWMHLIPSGIFYPRARCIIGNGMVVDPEGLLQEMDGLAAREVDTGNLFISERAHVIMPYHQALDRLEETRKGGRSIGTTGKGIGPAYGDKVGRVGIRMGDLLAEEVLLNKLSYVLGLKNEIITRVYAGEPFSLHEVYLQYLEYGRRLQPYIADTYTMVQEAVDAGQPVLLEGAQGTLLDIDYGTYPFVTSSSPVAGGATLGAGIAPTDIDEVVGVFKAYCTRVGNGPLPTELHDETGEHIRARGHEYGTTTGRPRRCGWFDSVAARFAVRLNGMRSMAITRLDVLDALPTVKVCTAYRVNQAEVTTMPSRPDVLEKLQPAYEEHPGWMEPTSGARSYHELPLNARRYLERLAELAGAEIAMVSVGPERAASIVLRDLFA